ncbi:hypothetical protein H2198_009348 [Neophaeococcomyces mojaviensis]|uniref:Uncharacterized protein n=1 Tax=Neophaeococcomyces mojaviensis TaxID=3383035 RepID=A0ACC2ZUW0_9EURO|nr:hypothetical protein H2198_009348 [Knufia sp. JES_112]
MKDHHLHMPHILGTTHHKPIDPTTPISPQEHQPKKKIAKQVEALHAKAKQSHSHYEKAAREGQKSESMPSEAAVRAAREVVSVHER